MNKCLSCDKETDNEKFCSNKCSGKYRRGKNSPHYKKRIKIKCKYCKKIKEVLPCYKNRKFCNKKCFGLYYRGKNSPVYKKRLKKYCDCGCGKLLEGFPSQIKKKQFYSNKCRGKYITEYQSGENHPNYKKRLKKYCLQCNELLEREFPYQLKNAKFCDQKCHGVYMFGRKCPAYVNGQGRFPYPLEFNNKLKEQIRKRDDYKCQECNISEKKLKRKLVIHHINYNKKNNNTNNLISLCNSCHMQTNFDRNDWKVYFQNKIRGVK